MGPNDNLKESSSPNLTPVLGYLSILRQEMMEVLQENDELHKLSRDVSFLAANHSSHDERLKMLEDSFMDLHHRLNSKHGIMQVNYEIEIIGVPETSGENLTNIVLFLVCEKLCVELCEFDIDDVMRIGHKDSGKPRPILLTMLRRQKRFEIINASKTIRNLSSEELVSGTSNRIYINERLPKESRMLFHEARLRANTYGFRYCWVRNGRIHVRQDSDMPSINISSTFDLDEKVGPAIQPGSSSPSSPH